MKDGGLGCRIGSFIVHFVLNIIVCLDAPGLVACSISGVFLSLSVSVGGAACLAGWQPMGVPAQLSCSVSFFLLLSDPTRPPLGACSRYQQPVDSSFKHLVTRNSGKNKTDSAHNCVGKLTRTILFQKLQKLKVSASVFES